MYNKEKFHNALALALGFEIVKDKRLNIIVDDKSDDSPKVTISVVGTSMKIEYVVVEDCIDVMKLLDSDEKIKAKDKPILMNVIKAVNTAYKESLKELATF